MLPGLPFRLGTAMGSEATIMTVTIGGAVLAVWLWVRIGGRYRPSLRATVVHAVIACLTVNFAPYVVDSIVGIERTHRGALVFMMVVFLPALTYMFLASLYLFEQLQRRLYAR